MINRKKRIISKRRGRIPHIPRYQNDKKRNSGANTFLVVINSILAILLAVIPLIFTYFSSEQQYNRQIDDKKDDRKFEIFEQTSRNLEEYERLFESQMRITFLIMSETKGAPFQSTGKLRKYVDKLSTDLSEDYQSVIEYQKKLAEFIGSLEVAKAAFGKDTQKIIDDFLINVVKKQDTEYWIEFNAWLEKMGVELGKNISSEYISYYINSDTGVDIQKYKNIIREAMAKEIDSLQQHD